MLPNARSENASRQRANIAGGTAAATFRLQDAGWQRIAMPQASPGSGSAARSPHRPNRKRPPSLAPSCCLCAPTPGRSAGSRCRQGAPCDGTREGGSRGWPRGGTRGGAPASVCGARWSPAALLAQRLALLARQQPRPEMTASSARWFVPRPAQRSPGRRQAPSRSEAGSWIFDLSRQPRPKHPHRMVEHCQVSLGLTIAPRFRSPPRGTIFGSAKFSDHLVRNDRQAPILL